MFVIPVISNKLPNSAHTITLSVAVNTVSCFTSKCRFSCLTNSHWSAAEPRQRVKSNANRACPPPQSDWEMLLTLSL